MASNAYSVPVNLHLASTAWLLAAPPHIILPRDASGEPGPQYPPKQPPHLNYAINICRGVMDHSEGRKAYERFATKFSIGRPTSWYLQGSSRMTMNQVSKTFIEVSLVQFPVVVKDYALKNPDYKGFHTRRPYDGDFKPTHQAISVNAYVSSTFMRDASISQLVTHLFRRSQQQWHWHLPNRPPPIVS